MRSLKHEGITVYPVANPPSKRDNLSQVVITHSHQNRGIKRVRTKVLNLIKFGLG